MDNQARSASFGDACSDATGAIPISEANDGRVRRDHHDRDGDGSMIGRVLIYAAIVAVATLVLWTRVG